MITWRLNHDHSWLNLMVKIHFAHSQILSYYPYTRAHVLTHTHTCRQSYESWIGSNSY